MLCFIRGSCGAQAGYTLLKPGAQGFNLRNIQVPRAQGLYVHCFLTLGQGVHMNMSQLFGRQHLSVPWKASHNPTKAKKRLSLSYLIWFPAHVPILKDQHRKKHSPCSTIPGSTECQVLLLLPPPKALPTSQSPSHCAAPIFIPAGPLKYGHMLPVDQWMLHNPC